MPGCPGRRLGSSSIAWRKAGWASGRHGTTGRRSAARPHAARRRRSGTAQGTRRSSRSRVPTRWRARRRGGGSVARGVRQAGLDDDRLGPLGNSRRGCRRNREKSPVGAIPHDASSLCTGTPGSAKSQYSPAIMARPSRAIATGRCSFRRVLRAGGVGMRHPDGGKLRGSRRRCRSEASRRDLVGSPEALAVLRAIEGDRPSHPG